MSQNNKICSTVYLLAKCYTVRGVHDSSLTNSICKRDEGQSGPS